MPIKTNAPVLVTGITGFVGAHVAHQLLEKGYIVRGTVRSSKKFDQVKSLPEFAKYAQDGKLQLVEIPDVTDSDFTEALKDVEAVIHVASPFNMAWSKPEQYLDPAIKGTTNVIKAAKKAGVKNFVVTSSFAAVIDLNDSDLPFNGKKYTEADWNPITYEEAIKTDLPVIGYCASKKLAEKAALDFAKNEAPEMKVATIQPPMIFGPIINPPSDMKSLNESNQQIWDLLRTTEGDVPPTGFPPFVDVRDVAAAHIAAFEKDREGRFLTYAASFSNEEVIKFAHEQFPEQSKKLIQADISKAPTTNPKLYTLDNTRSRTELGIQYLSFQETFKDMIAQLYKLAEKAGAP